MNVMETTYVGLSLAELSAKQIGVSFDEQIVLIDRFDGCKEEEAMNSYFAKYPVKVSFYIVILCVSGKIKFRINLHDYELTTSDFLFVQEGAIGEFCSISNDAQLAIMAFAPQFFNFADNLRHAIRLQLQLFSTPKITLNDATKHEYLAVYQLMKEKIGETDNIYRKGALQGYAQVLTYNAFNYLLSPTDAESNGNCMRQDSLYTRFMQLVGQHFRSERTIAFYADCLCVTPKYLSQMVYRASGRFAGDWIRAYVILEAKAMLKSRHHTIQQVANYLNFHSQSIFGKYFKNATGMSPTEFREST